MNDNVYKVGETVMITGGQRAGCRAKILKKLNAHAIRAKIVGGICDGQVLPNVRFDHYSKIV